MGILLFEMLFGALPFKHIKDNPRDFSASIASLQFNFPQKYNRIVSDDARDLISKILVPHGKRISLSNIKKHKWL